MKPLHYLVMGLLLQFSAATAFAADAVQDPDMSVNPVTLQFPITTLGTSSTPALFTITNNSGSSLSLGTRILGGVNPTEFTLGTTDCGASLSAGGSCTVAVSFSPNATTGKGTKSATLLIPYGSGKTLTAFLTNGSSPTVEAQRRMPAVLSAVSIPDTMSVSGSPYTLTWSVEGYDAAYSSYAVMFDCTGISDGSCGNNYSDPTKFAESPIVTNTTGTPGIWTYGTARTKRFSYSWSFTVPPTRPGGGAWASTPGTEVVVRIYQRSDVDAARNNPYVSLLIPGNLATIYYDTVGRRIIKRITP